MKYNNYDDFYISEKGFGHYFNDESLELIPYVYSDEPVKIKETISKCDCLGKGMNYAEVNGDGQTCKLCNNYVFWGEV